VAGWLPALIVALTAAAWHNSFGGPFIWDGRTVILENARIRTLGLAALSGTSRPLTQLSFALNHAVGGMNVTGYHVTNLAIHVLAALMLFAVVARTLATPRLAARTGARAPWLAGAIAVLWAVHPLQTESVTYVVQRSEALAGLFVLLVLYSFQRGATSARPLPWFAFAALSMLLGIATKPVAAVAPLLVLLYDRCFLAGSFREAIARRGWVLGALLACTAALPLWLAAGRREWAVSSGFGMSGVTAGSYALTQLAVVAHYLRLSLWPAPLVLDYAWPMARNFAAVLPGGLVTVALLAATAAGVARNHPLGFAGAWVFVTLAPTSSVFPIQDAAFEHRMYLPLAGVVAVGVVAALGWLPRPSVARRTRSDATGAAALAAGALVVAAALALVHGTTRRNDDYRSAIAIWTDTVAKRPENPRAHTFLGQALADAGRTREAIAELQAAVRLNPDYGLALGSLTRVLEQSGQIPPEQAANDYARALALNPDLTWTRVDQGFTLLRLGRYPRAADAFGAALGHDPDLASAHYGRGVALAMLGRAGEGRGEIARAVALYPDEQQFRRALAWVDSLSAGRPTGAR
jgi:protein O-mannosyl-transferase